MAIAFAIFGVAFGAFCVWLTVRIVNRRERWAKWTLAAVLVSLAMYLASFGLLIKLPDSIITRIAWFYRPVFIAGRNLYPFRELMDRYVDFISHDTAAIRWDSPYFE
jgi:hypothetical protein